MKRMLKMAAVVSPFMLAACGGGGAMNEVALATSNMVGDIVGPRVTDNSTVYSPALACLKGQLPADMVLAVGPIPDKTGKYVIEEDGAILPKSASEMAVTAVHLSGARQVDRLTAGITEWELKFASKKVLGDGKMTTVKTKKGDKKVAFRVIKPGDMLGSTNYMTGSVSELNWNTFSGGGELEIMGIGGGARTFMMTVAVDLKLVDTRSTVVVDNVTYKKRILGYETKGGVFRFFGTSLVNFNIGEKSQEPIQTALRAIVERSTYELLSRKAPAAQKALCDNLLKDGDDKVVTLEAVPADKIPTADNSVDGENGDMEVSTPVIIENIDASDTAASAPTSSEDDADKHDAWKAKKGMRDGS